MSSMYQRGIGENVPHLGNMELKPFKTHTTKLQCFFFLFLSAVRLKYSLKGSPFFFYGEIQSTEPSHS